MDRYAVDAALDRLGQALGEDVSRRVLLRRVAGGGLAVVITAGGLRVASVEAQDGTPAPAEASPMASPAATRPHRFAVGQLNCLVVDDGSYVLPASLLAVNAGPRELAEEVGQIGAPADAVPIRVNILLVEAGDQLVLVDTGSGAFAPTTGRLLPNLQAEGIAPGDIDVVLMTHLHGDHYAAAVDAQGKPTFPNARYLINQAEYEFWNAEPSLAELPIPEEFRQVFREGAKGVIGALGNRLEQIRPGMEIARGVTPIAAPGHTPGHLAVEVSSGGETLLHIVDAAVHPVLNLEHPDWFLAPVNWPAHDIITRRQLLDRAATEGLLVQTYHFPFPGLGRVTPDGDGWLWEAAT